MAAGAFTGSNQMGTPEEECAKRVNAMQATIDVLHHQKENQSYTIMNQRAELDRLRRSMRLLRAVLTDENGEWNE